ncbi:MAG: molybdate ABC transporter permease subunit, partial [Nannocystis sp.]|nr:molybdate ABC transporter permease subunit [Nannocystis sp.]
MLGVLGGAALVFFALPLVALIGRVTPAELWEQLGSPAVQQALRLSLEVSLISLGLCVV